MAKDNRRDDRRISGGFRVDVLHRQRVVAQGTSLDVSAGGMGLQTPQDLPVGMIYELRMNVCASDGAGVSVHGRVENARPGYIGFAVDPACRHQFKRVIDQWHEALALEQAEPSAVPSFLRAA